MISLHDQPGLMGECKRAIRGKGAHGPPAIIVMGGRWEVASPLSYSHVGRNEMDHAPVRIDGNEPQ